MVLETAMVTAKVKLAVALPDRPVVLKNYG
jgi:hypothetical protein